MLHTSVSSRREKTSEERPSFFAAINASTNGVHAYNGWENKGGHVEVRALCDIGDESPLVALHSWRAVEHKNHSCSSSRRVFLAASRQSGRVTIASAGARKSFATDYADAI